MSQFESDDHESIDARTARALTERMTVLPDDGDGLHTIVTESGAEYTVDVVADRCTCPDYRHRDVRCKHLRRVAFAVGDRPVPATVDRDDVDPMLADAVDATPAVAVADGGVAVDADADDVGPDAGDGRPADCDCGSWNAGEGLPCWPCYRDGFETPASE